jgi:hypothetical protein
MLHNAEIPRGFFSLACPALFGAGFVMLLAPETDLTTAETVTPLARRLVLRAAADSSSAATVPMRELDPSPMQRGLLASNVFLWRPMRGSEGSFVFESKAFPGRRLVLSASSSESSCTSLQLVDNVTDASLLRLRSYTHASQPQPLAGFLSRYDSTINAWEPFTIHGCRVRHRRRRPYIGGDAFASAVRIQRSTDILSATLRKLVALH